MPTFCRHNRFVERCPICSKDLPGRAPAGGRAARASTAARPRSGSTEGRRRGTHGVRVRREQRSVEDGFSSPLVPGLRASADAERLAHELAFSAARLLALATEPPGVYGDASALAASDLERATWACVLCVYLCPVEGDDPFLSIRTALASAPTLRDQLPDLEGIELGPRTSHDPARGSATLLAYRQWVERAGGEDGTQAAALRGDDTWTPERRFARLFERLALPGLGRAGRYDLLVTLGRLGLYEIRADSLQLSTGRVAPGGEDATVLAAKRVFGIADPILLDRRASALAEGVGVPIETLDLALANWGSEQRATLGMSPDLLDPAAHERAVVALGL